MNNVDDWVINEQKQILEEMMDRNRVLKIDSQSWMEIQRLKLMKFLEYVYF